MDDPTTIHVNELRALLQYRGGKAGALVSMPPLSFPAGRDVTLDNLRSTGLVDSSGQISPAIRPTLEGIAQAEWSNQIILPGPEGDVTTYVAYYTPDHRFWGLQVEDGGLTTLCSMDELHRSLLSIFTNDSSSATSIAFTYRFLQDDIYVLVAMIELVLMNSNNQKTGAEAKMQVDDSINPIFNALRVLDGIYINAPGPIDELMNLVSSPARRISILLSPLIAYRPQTLNEIQESLPRLVTANLVKPTQTGWILTPEIAAFARDLVPTDQVAYLEKHSIAQGRLETEDMLMIAGKGNKLFFCIRPQTDDQVELSGYIKLSWEAFLGEFFNHPLQTLKAASSSLGVLEPEAGQIPTPMSPADSSLQKPSPSVTEGIPPAPVAALSSSDATLITSRPASIEILVLNGELKNQRFPVGKQLRLGRETDNDLTLPDQKASRHHAIIQRQGVVYQITDLNSGNGTYVNEKRINEPTLLKNGDIILIGDTQLTISDKP